MTDSREELVFTYLAERQLPELLNRNHYLGKNNFNEIVLQTIVNDIFPLAEEDEAFLRLIWPLVRKDYLLWYKSQTRDGMLFAELMEGTKSLVQFLEKANQKEFMPYLRRKFYRAAFHDVPASDDFSSLLQPLYEQHGLKMVTTKLQSSHASSVINICTKYYKELGYKFEDGHAVNSDSIYVLTREGKIPLLPSTFNLGIFPWVLNESISAQTGHYDTQPMILNEYGWSKSQLIQALRTSVKEDISLLEKMSKQQLAMIYRVTFGTDGYVDWDSVLKYRYLTKANLKTVAFETFNKPRDTLENTSYQELIHDLKLMSLKSLDIVEKARLIVRDATGIVDDRAYRGLAYLLRSNTEDPASSFWYKDLSGNMKLMYKGNFIPNELIITTYGAYKWACARSDEISVNYFILIAQRLGIWPVLARNKHSTSTELCDAIANLLDELEPAYSKLEKEEMKDINEATDRWLEESRKETERLFGDMS